MKKKLFSIIMIMALIVATAVTSFATSDPFSKEDVEGGTRGVTQTKSASGYAYRDYDLNDNTLQSTKLRAYGTANTPSAEARTYLYNQTSSTQYCTSYVEEHYQTPDGTLYGYSSNLGSVSAGNPIVTGITRHYANMNRMYHHFGSRYNASSAGGANSYSLAVTLIYDVYQ